MKKSSTSKPKFMDFMRDKGSVPMLLVHQDSKTDRMLTMSEVMMRYNDKLSPNTIRQYMHTGAFPYPVAVLLNQRALAWLFDADEVEEYFNGVSSAKERVSAAQERHKRQHEEVLAKARRAGARAQRLRYKAKKMENKFIITTKEGK